MDSRRLDDLKKFYDLLTMLEVSVGGARTLAVPSPRDWPHRGIYFFQEQGENRKDTGSGLRVVRVGTHAVSEGSSTKLWNRLSQHRGTLNSGGGNHRGSVFRAIVGHALIDRHQLSCPTWDEGNNAPSDIRQPEEGVEKEVSRYIRAMPFLWLDVDDEPSKNSLRKIIERNSIALLSNYSKEEPIDQPSSTWLGHHCKKEKVRLSGLWNSDHVEESYDAAFLDVLERLIIKQGLRK